MKSLTLTRVACLLAGLALAPAAQAHDHPFGPWSAAIPLTPLNSPGLDGCPFPSRDGLTLYFASTREGSRGIDIWVSTRASTDAAWGTPVNLGPEVNSDANDYCPSPARGGRFMFVSTRPGGCGTGTGDIYVTRLRDDGGWDPPRNLGCDINSAAEEAGPVRVRHALYFSSTRSGNSDIYMSRIHGQQIDEPAPVAELNTPSNEARPFVLRDEEIVFDSDRPGSQGLDIWSAIRRKPGQRWSDPVNLGSAVNSAAAETRPSLSRDGTTLYFGSTRGTSQDLFTASRER